MSNKGVFKHETVMIIHGRASYAASGAENYISSFLMQNNLKPIHFCDFSINPKKEDVDKGVAIMNDKKPDQIIAIGGGSVIDVAKLVRHFSGRHDIPLTAIPTTAGTGAEATQFAVCYIGGVKHSISAPSILPNKVVLRPELTYNNPPYLTACTGFDALAQAIEAFWNINSTKESDAYAIQAINLLFPTLPKKRLTHKDRAILLKGANLSGRAINITKTTVPHALSYTLTSKYGYPHGHAVALTFPFFLQYNLLGDKKYYQGTNFEDYKIKMEILCDMLHTVPEESFSMMKDYSQQMGLGFDSNRDFDDKIVAKGINMERAKNTPIAINDKIIQSAVDSIR